MSSRTPEPPDFPASQLFLRRLAFSLVRDEARAEDLVQDTWATWVEHRPSGIAEPRAWLARVLRNRAFNEKRSERRRAEREELAGRPDPSMPEVDGTLEAQAQLLEALRKLEEPYRSTLVERYYHDLSPTEISARSGAPLNTIKARLSRGLEKLRGEMDRRYGGDRGAWCHWLVSLGSPPVAPVPSWPAGTASPPVSPTWISPAVGKGAGGAWKAGAPAALGTWILLAGAVVSGVGWVLWRSTRGVSPSSPVTFVQDEPRVPDELQAVPREAQHSEPIRSTPAVVIVPKTEAPAPETVPVPAALPFEWPQLAGTATHDDFSAFRERIDLIQRPRVLWSNPGFAGQPTISGTELYSGGDALFRVDLASNEVSAGSADVFARIRAARGTMEGDEAKWRLRLARHGLTGSSWVAGAPAITREAVLARMVGDGSVSAFDRDLAHELWHWEPSVPAPCPLSGCLVGEQFLVAHGHEVVSLSAVNGAEDWRFDTGDAGEVDMVPACDGDLVYFATDGGVVFALDFARGKEEWRTKTERVYVGAYPVVFGDRIVLADEGIADVPPWRRRAELRAFQTYDGRELWHAAFDPYSNVGVGDGFAAVVGGSETVLFSVESGGGRSYLYDSVRSYRAWSAAVPVVVGREILLALNEDGGRVIMRDLDRGTVRWTYDLGPKTAVLDVVHAGDRIYVATTAGLVCIADDPGKEPAPPGFVLGAGAGSDEDEDEREMGSRKPDADGRRKR